MGVKSPSATMSAQDALIPSCSSLSFCASMEALRSASVCPDPEVLTSAVGALLRTQSLFVIVSAAVLFAIAVSSCTSCVLITSGSSLVDRLSGVSSVSCLV